jgi:hypothetical protein
MPRPTAGISSPVLSLNFHLVCSKVEFPLDEDILERSSLGDFTAKMRRNGDMELVAKRKISDRKYRVAEMKLWVWLE